MPNTRSSNGSIYRDTTSLKDQGEEENMFPRPAPCCSASSNLDACSTYSGNNILPVKQAFKVMSVAFVISILLLSCIVGLCVNFVVQTKAHNKIVLKTNVEEARIILGDDFPKKLSTFNDSFNFDDVMAYTDNIEYEIDNNNNAD